MIWVTKGIFVPCFILIYHTKRLFSTENSTNLNFVILLSILLKYYRYFVPNYSYSAQKIPSKSVEKGEIEVKIKKPVDQYTGMQ